MMENNKKAHVQRLLIFYWILVTMKEEVEFANIGSHSNSGNRLRFSTNNVIF